MPNIFQDIANTF